MVKDLINRSLSNDQKAQRELYEMHKVSWFMICLRYFKERSDAEDALQNGLIQIFTKLHQFDNTKAKFKTWAYKIMVNECLQLIRKKSSILFTDNESIMEAAYDSNPDIIETMSVKELMALIHEIPTGYKVVFNLYVVEGYTHKEISGKLGISEGTSKSQLFKAKKLLQKKIEALQLQESYGQKIR